jgi:phage gp37-like protein
VTDSSVPATAGAAADSALGVQCRHIPAVLVPSVGRWPPEEAGVALLKAVSVTDWLGGVPQNAPLIKARTVDSPSTERGSRAMLRKTVITAEFIAEGASRSEQAAAAPAVGLTLDP